MNQLEITREMKVLKLDKGSWEAAGDCVIMEYPFTLYGNGVKLREFNCTPEEMEELSVGALFTMGKIHSTEDILSLTIDRDKGTGHALYREEKPETEAFSPMEENQAYGFRLKVSHEKIQIPAEDIFRMMEENLEPTALFSETGGVHMVSLYGLNDRKRLLKKEDAARHNAVDKVLGCAIKEGISLKDTILAVSGRVSGEILDKALTASIPVVLSKAAPTVQSVERAEEAGITLIGFIRNHRMNIYTHPWRILVPDEVYEATAAERRKGTVRKSKNLTGGIRR